MEETDKEVHLRITGRFDRELFRDFQDRLAQLDLRDRKLILDLSELSVIDSCGLGMLLVAREVAEAHAVTIRGAAPDLRRVLEMVNFGTLFEIE